MGRMKAGWLRPVATLALALSVWAATAAAQAPLPRDLFQERLRQQGDSLTFCLNPDAMLADFDRAVAQELGAILLIEARIDPVKPMLATLPLDYRLPLTTDQLYLLLAEECDAFMGFTLAASGYPDWMRVTRDYLSTRMVMVTHDPAIKRLEDLPFGKAIGLRSLSAADNRLISYLLSLPADRRWQRKPYYNNEQVLAALADGSIGVAMIWEPALRHATGNDPEGAGYHIIPMPFNTDPVLIGIAIRSVDSYLQTLLSDGIKALVDDGTIDRLLAEHGFGAKAKQ